MNRDILDAQRTDVYHSKMATTIAGVYISNDSFIAFNVGDSRVYRLRGSICCRYRKIIDIRKKFTQYTDT